jgi:hypothetical protein
MTKATAIVDANTAAFERKIEIAKQRMGTMGQALGPANSMLGHMGKATGAITVAAISGIAVWRDYAAQLDRAASSGRDLARSSAEIAARSGDTSAGTRYQKAIEDAAPNFVGGVQGATAALSSYQRSRGKISGPDEANRALGVLGKADEAGYDAAQFGERLGKMAKIGIDAEKAGDMIATAFLAGMIDELDTAITEETKAPRRRRGKALERAGFGESTSMYREGQLDRDRRGALSDEVYGITRETERQRVAEEVTIDRRNRMPTLRRQAEQQERIPQDANVVFRTVAGGIFDAFQAMGRYDTPQPPTIRSEPARPQDKPRE